MAPGAQLAVTLDEEMLGAHGVLVHPPWTPDAALPIAPNVITDLGDRFLVKYVRSADTHRYSIFSGITHFPGWHYLTPTPLARSQVVKTLNLPGHLPTPRFALLLDPRLLTAFGPRRIRSGSGIEYLVNGFDAAAIVSPGWAVEID